MEVLIFQIMENKNPHNISNVSVWFLHITHRDKNREILEISDGCHKSIGKTRFHLW